MVSSSQSASVIHSGAGSSPSEMVSSSQSGSSGHGSSSSRMKSSSRSGSSSRIDTCTFCCSTAAKSWSEPWLSIWTVTSVICVLSIIWSSRPVTITSCGVSQFAGVNVREVVASASSKSVTVIFRITSEIGSAVSFTVKTSVEPVSSTTVSFSVSSIVNPATSSSRFVPVTVCSATASKSSSEAAGSISTVTSKGKSPSIRKSLAPVTVTLWGIFQFSGVKIRTVVVIVASSEAL